MSSFAHSFRRELRVCFSLKTQPLWVRLVKWTVVVLAARYHDAPWFWPGVAACFVAGLGLHFVYRWQTRAWTRSWGGWDDVKSADGFR